MKILAYLLLLYGALLLFNAVRQEYSGHTTIAPPTRDGFIYAESVSRSQNPAWFKNAMTYNWTGAFLCVAAGLILLSLIRGQDRLDPMSPSFAGKEEIDKLSDPPEK